MKTRMMMITAAAGVLMATVAVPANAHDTGFDVALRVGPALVYYADGYRYYGPPPRYYHDRRYRYSHPGHYWKARQRAERAHARWHRKHDRRGHRHYRRGLRH